MFNYTNGNTQVTILEDGTKIREYENTPLIVHPESIDIKITNFCDMGCKFCHESSTVKGEHGDLDRLREVINCLPAGVELAIGGGNPLSHPDLVSFLQVLKQKGIIANITINQGHLKTYRDLITYLIVDDLVKGIGISINSKKFNNIVPFTQLTNNIVYHVIAGVHDVEILDNLKSFNNEYDKICKVLVLGYKQFGFGINYFSPEVEQGIKDWKKGLRNYVGQIHLSFDNLAIEQLDIRCWFSKEKWNQFYMGDDFTFTMYIDAVKQEFAPTSRSEKRVSFNKMSLLDYFQTYKNEEIN